MKVPERNNEIIASVGQRVNQERKARGLRLADLSTESGISVSMLSKFENGRITLNFRHMVEIARALNIPVRQLMGVAVPTAPSARKSFTQDGGGYFQQSDRLDFEILCDDLAHRHNIFWKVWVKSRTIEDYGQFSRHPGEEFILVLEGAIDLHTESYRPLRLNKGDSVHFDGTDAHAYIATSEVMPVLLMSNTVEEDLPQIVYPAARSSDIKPRIKSDKKAG